ncbi:hypothetical protein A2227_03080 [Candidatus Falkowbacteria bacterium RIFOXYA2_FULL_47_19]|uniref:SbsA Ig-like domain-containing protein n=1 Tax=Candidatus Falkowbacteria bacterium RIFOXYA2_FULL_47_19 TaxID=1797994 RepID=A0A1F5SIG3_9BACT|nr:MAG: hypothetical protein A2227_03080 [Candidatus Falkowbacteria bacterium RIFOXYA2_FULL_47_19]
MIKRKKIIFLGFVGAVIVIITGFFIATEPVSAQTAANNMLWGGTEGNVQTATGLGNTDPRIIIANIIRVLLGFLGIIAVLLIMYAGWLWTTSAGDESKINKAKQTLTAAIVGLIIILMSFAIVSFILSRLLGATTYNPGSGGGPGAGIGLVALGNCSLLSVYPEPGQAEVPRNVGIIVTFREPIDPATIMDGSNNILTDSVMIFHQSDQAACLSGGSCPSLVDEVLVSTNDNATFFLDPVNYLGSPSEYINYGVYLSNDIELANGTPVFRNCANDYALWGFQVSNRLDLTPPQVVDGGIIPPPDNAPDAVSTAPAVRAAGAVTVTSQPRAAAIPSYAAVNPPGATVVIDPNNQASGNLTVTVMTDGVTAQLTNGATPLGAANFVGNTVTFPGVLSLTAPGPVSAGNFWTITGVTARVNADIIRVDNRTYSFGVDIATNPNLNTVAANIAAALAGHPSITASAAGPVVTVTAVTAGQGGNNILLSTNNPVALSITPMSGGQDDNDTVTIQGGARDVPRNIVIQTNFNEAMNPITLSGDAADVAPYIRIVNIGTGGTLTGRFLISNGYRTVEFISDDLCGVNACGERIYCLPALSNLRVELTAAPLAGCGADNCASRSPYDNCAGGHCEDAAGINYPLSLMPLSGIADACANSLDGNRDSEAVGPVNSYNENAPAAGTGDNFQWSFYVSDILDLTPPEIDALTPINDAANVSLADPVVITCSKLMMSSSLKTGSVSVVNGNDTVIHRAINLWSLANRPVGYWVVKNDLDDNNDGIPDRTQAEIRHAPLGEFLRYRSQAGSGIKDIYQNCFNPSVSATCAGTPSCCSEVPTAGSSCP